jgi:hypothetical protein
MLLEKPLSLVGKVPGFGDAVPECLLRFLNLPDLLVRCTVHANPPDRSTSPSCSRSAYVGEPTFIAVDVA